MTLYMDHAASTPCGQAAWAAMQSWLSGCAGNAQSRHHAYGLAAAKAIEQARCRIAARIGGKPEGIVFTSGATEANNLIFSGLADHLKKTGKTHLVTIAVEHKSVLMPLLALREQGFTVSIPPVQPCGMIEADMIEAALTPQTGLVSVQAVNNELGTIQPLDEIAAMLRGRDILFHTDAAQAPGKIEFSIEAAGVDAASLSAHKAYGPQGIGALYIRPELKFLMKPAMQGGGQQDGLRSGTLPVALCAGFGAAFATLTDDRQRLQTMRDRFLARIAHLEPVVHGHTNPAWNAPGILTLRFPGIDSETLVMELPGLAFGLGSACNTGGNRLSHVMQAIENGDRPAREAIRLSFGQGTTEKDMDEAADQIAAIVTTIRHMKEAA